MTQLAVGTLAMQSGSRFAKAYTEGLHKSRYWEPVLEDSLDLIAKLPALAARIYRRTYHGGKFIEAKVRKEERREREKEFLSRSLLERGFFRRFCFLASLSHSPLSHSLPPLSSLSLTLPTLQISNSRASTGPPTSPT